MFSEFRIYRKKMKTTARCYKGFSILFVMWGVGALVVAGVVPAVIITAANKQIDKEETPAIQQT